MPSQRPYFLSSFIAAFRQAPPPNANQQQQNQNGGKQHNGTASNSASSSSSSSSSAQQQHQTTSSPSTSPGPTASAIAAANHHHHHHPHHHHHHHRHGVTLHSPANHGHASPIGIPIPSGGGRRRGSDSSSEGFRDAIGADKWYIGGRTATGEEKFFKLGVVRRVRSNDGLSLDRLSL
ncbi:hypothetical protein PWT90_01780 [Aphanocladium album]|nr:hypothetical protein PWT90_01780 [Aphanocladium album]